jgi:hypothetical protein
LENKEIHMTKKGISRANIFSDLAQKKITQVKAAKILDVSLRHLQRIYAEYKKRGVTSLASKQRGKASNHQLPRGLKVRVSELVTCELYAGFKPTFMCEKLEELHGIIISVETTRQIMIENGVWESKKQKRPVIHQQRESRDRFGELNQIDGSPHAWFEDRGDPCVLINFVDDATGRTYGLFHASETTEAYMITTKQYILKYGRPLAFYPDKYSVFRINKPGCVKKELITQFGRACKELDIKLICANSPQAKGKVERNNQTQQDRLVKELRLAGVSTIAEGNRFLEEYYWEKYNRKFAKPAKSKVDAHRKLLPEHDLEKILCYKSHRTISKNLELQYKNVIYQIKLEKPSWTLRGAKVTIIECLDGKIFIEYRGKYLPFTIHSQQEFVGDEIPSKEINRFLRETRNRKVSYVHPWKQQGRAEFKMRQYKRMIGT